MKDKQQSLFHRRPIELSDESSRRETRLYGFLKAVCLFLSCSSADVMSVESFVYSGSLTVSLSLSLSLSHTLTVFLTIRCITCALRTYPSRFGNRPSVLYANSEPALLHGLSELHTKSLMVV